MKMTKLAKIFIVAMGLVLIVTIWASSAGWSLRKPAVAKKSIRHGSVQSGTGHRTHGYYVGK